MSIYPAYVQLPLQFDPQKLKEDFHHLKKIEWISHFVTRDYAGDWSAIPLRMQARAKDMHPIISILSDPYCTDWVDSPYLEQSPYFQEVLASFQCDLESVRIMRLGPGSEIKEHTDDGLDFEEGAVRLHIPIQTHADVEFYLNGERVIMEEGECWYLRFMDPHRVLNKSEQDRIHIVIDTTVNDWLRNLFKNH